MSARVVATCVSAALLVPLCVRGDDGLVPGELRAYHESHAALHAHLATAANCGKSAFGHNRALETWSCGPACDAVPNMTHVRVVEDDHDAYAYVGRLGSDCVLTFRGTSKLVGWLADLQSGEKLKLEDWGVPCSFAGEPCSVGWGFVENYARLAEGIRGNLSEIGCDARPLVVTGHSLGAAEAAVAMLDLKNRGYTLKETYLFGCPRVGNSAFTSAFEAAFSSRHVFRVTHYKDPVPHLPPYGFGFRHLPTEVYYGQGNTTADFTVCDGSSDHPACAGQWSFGPALLLACIYNEGRKAQTGGCDHLTYLAGATNHRMATDACVDGSQVDAPGTPVLV